MNAWGRVSLLPAPGRLQGLRLRLLLGGGLLGASTHIHVRAGALNSEDRCHTPPTTQRGWCIEAFVSILVQSQSQRSLPGGGGV